MKLHQFIIFTLFFVDNMEGGEHDYTGVGINPMYQSSGTIATQDSGTQYDEIKTRPRQIVHKSPERVTTSNSLYASTNEMLLKHPTLGGGGNGQLLSSVSPDLSFKDVKERFGCPCSSDAAIFSCSMLVILLSSKQFVILLFIIFCFSFMFATCLPLSSYCYHTDVTINVWCS